MNDFQVEQEVIFNYSDGGKLKSGARGKIIRLYENSCLVNFYDFPQIAIEVSKNYLK